MKDHTFKQDRVGPGFRENWRRRWLLRAADAPPQILPPRATIFIICQPQYINTADYGNTAVADDDTSRQVGNSPRPKMQILSLSDGIGFDQGFASSWVPFSSKCKPVCHKDLCAGESPRRRFFCHFFPTGNKEKPPSQVLQQNWTLSFFLLNTLAQL